MIKKCVCCGVGGARVKVSPRKDDDSPLLLLLLLLLVTLSRGRSKHELVSSIFLSPLCSRRSRFFSFSDSRLRSKKRTSKSAAAFVSINKNALKLFFFVSVSLLLCSVERKREKENCVHISSNTNGENAEKKKRTHAVSEEETPMVRRKISKSSTNVPKTFVVKRGNSRTW